MSSVNTAPCPPRSGGYLSCNVTTITAVLSATTFSASGAALVHKVCATTPAATQKLARRPSSYGAQLRPLQSRAGAARKRPDTEGDP